MKITQKKVTQSYTKKSNIKKVTQRKEVTQSNTKESKIKKVTQRKESNTKKITQRIRGKYKIQY